MKLRIGKKGISISGFRLKADDIEQQVVSDLISYRKNYSSRYGIVPALPLDVENFIKELWDVEVNYKELPQSIDEESLGCFDPEQRCIVVDAMACNNKKRISFTIAHEAGHLSLHAFLFSFIDGKVVGWKNNQPSANKNLERQADLYAASLLAPKQEIYDFLKEKGLTNGNVLTNPIDMSVYAPLFQEHFGLSRQALEIRLSRLSLSMLNKSYPD